MAPRGRPKEWNEGKIARLGMLMGAGWSCARIAQEMDTTEGAIRSCARRLKLHFSRVPNMATLHSFHEAALERGKEKGDLIIEVLGILNSDRALLENVIDDRG